jgi:hypothetical protein
MTDEAMSPLRRRMIEDMAIRKLARKTQQHDRCVPPIPSRAKSGHPCALPSAISLLPGV